MTKGYHSPVISEESANKKVVKEQASLFRDMSYKLEDLSPGDVALSLERLLSEIKQKEKDIKARNQSQAKDLEHQIFLSEMAFQKLKLFDKLYEASQSEAISGDFQYKIIIFSIIYRKCLKFSKISLEDYETDFSIKDLDQELKVDYFLTQLIKETNFNLPAIVDYNLFTGDIIEELRDYMLPSFSIKEQTKKNI